MPASAQRPPPCEVGSPPRPPRPCTPSHRLKEPAVRLRVLEDAGRSAVPFTTGVLIGIGETYEEHADALFAIRRVSRQYHGTQEVIVQNFRAKPDTVMRAVPDAESAELAAAVAVARLVLGPSARIQAPPNLVGDAPSQADADREYALLLRPARLSVWSVRSEPVFALEVAASAGEESLRGA